MKKLAIAVVVVLALVGVLLLSLPMMLHKAGLHPEYDGPSVALPGKHVPHFKPGKALRERVDYSKS